MAYSMIGPIKLPNIVKIEGLLKTPRGTFNYVTFLLIYAP